MSRPRKIRQREQRLAAGNPSGNRAQRRATRKGSDSVTDDDQERPGIWVSSDFNPDGSASYIVTVSAGADVALSLRADAAVRYVAAVYRAGVIAQHDAAVLQQLTGRLGLNPSAAGASILDLREDREPGAGVTATSPLHFEPIISATNYAPYVHVWAGKKRISQWTPEDCFQHASQVMQVLAGVDLDSGYFRYLVHTCGTDPMIARAAVHDLGNRDAGLRDDVPSEAS